jgi:predicted dehydrogenase
MRYRFIFGITCFLVAANAGVWVQAHLPPAQPVGLRVGVVGFVHDHLSGFFGQLRSHPEVQIVGYVEPNRQLAAQIADRRQLDKSLIFTDLDEMLAKTHPQAVVTYTSTFDHRRVVEICARHGVHVMMEKPLAVSLEDARAIAKAARDGKISVMVNYETTWYRSNQAVFDLVHENALGEIRKIVVHDGHRGPKEIGCSEQFLAWLTDPVLNGGGALFDFGCYGADLATWLMDGQRPLTVTAVTQRIKPDVYPKVDDEATVLVTYPKAQLIIQASWNWPFDRKDMEVYGRTGQALTVARNDVRVRRAGVNQEQLSAGKPLAGPYEDNLSYLRAVVMGQIKPDGPSSLEINVITTEILDAARRSAATGKTVTLSKGK